MSSTYDLYSVHSANHDESSRYFGFSIALHITLAIASLFVVAPAFENLKQEITIELQTPEEKIIPPPVRSLAPPKGELVKATRGAARSLSPAPTAPLNADLSDVVKGPVQKSKTSRSKSAQIKTHTGSGKAKIAKTAASRTGVPETLEDIQAPVLDIDGVAVEQVGNLGDNEFENEFKNVDHSNAAAVKAQAAALDEETKLIADEKEAALQALENDNAAQAKAMEDALLATRTKNAAALAQIKASEKAAAERAARESALAAAAARNRGTGTSEAVAGRGNGATGADAASGAKTGVPSGVRSLDQLKQMPGNPKPQYSYEERLRRQQGSVIFYAFITKAGSPTQFKMMASTGFKNLDGKTLAALKKWKFYPGQEGWVEIPFRWDLKGGVQEMPTALRRFSSR